MGQYLIIGLWCRYGTASGEPASTTDPKPTLESAGLSGQVELGHPLLPSFLEKVGGGTCLQTRALSSPPDRMNDRAVSSSYAH